MRKKYGSSHPVSKQIINSVSELSCLFLTEGGKNTTYIMWFVSLVMILLHIWYQEFHMNGKPMWPLSNQDITSFEAFLYFTTYIGKEIY